MKMRVLTPVLLAMTLALGVSTSAQSPQAKEALELLESESAQDLAWAGHRAAELGLTEVAQRIAELVESPPRTRESGVERAYVFRAFADALFLNKVACGPKALRNLQAEHTPSRMVLAVASLDPKLSEDWLLEQLNGETEYEVYEVVVGILTATRSQDFFEWLLKEAEPNVRVHLKGQSSLGLGGSASGRFRGPKRTETHPPEGYPPLVDYGLSKQEDRGYLPLGTTGPGATQIMRGRLGLISKYKPKAGLMLARVGMLEDVFYATAAQPLTEELSQEGNLIFEADARPKEVHDRVQLARQALAEHYWNSLRSLFEKGYLEAAVLRRLRPRFPVVVFDLRPDGAPKLWRMEKAIKKPDWLRDIR